ncbi:hypothetical protein Q5752_006905 [Cryptotrichosporon argae]
MDRSSSRKNLRSERISNSPYARPEKTRSREHGGLKSFPSLSSLVSFVASPFRRAPSLPTHSTRQITHSATGDDKIDVDAAPSVSGSEDEWNGEPPEEMDGQDVFSLAAAGGREGDEFERRAETYRARGEVAGGRLDLARRGLTAPTSIFGLAPPSTGIRPSPSMPAIQSAAHSPTRIAPPSHATATLQTPRASALPVSASSVALSSFLEAKAGAPMTADDLVVLDTLTHSIKAEAALSSTLRSEAHTPARAGARPTRAAGWSAGSYTTPRTAGTSTPVQVRPFATTPGPAFSMGTVPASPTPRKVYLGPGMSPRRLQPKQKSGLKPLFSFDEPEASGLKKRRTDEFVDKTPAPPVPPLPTSIPAAPSPVPHPAAAVPTLSRPAASSTPVRPSPLSQSTAASPTPRDEIVQRAKKRAADIMREVIDVEIGPLDAAPAPIVFNPYEGDARRASPPAASASASAAAKTGTPRKSTSASALRSSIRSSGTPSRGAAEKIERLKDSGRKLTTLEKVSGFRPNSAAPPASHSPAPHTRPQPQHVRVETPDKERDMMDVDALVDGSPATPSPLHTPAPASSTPKPARSALKLPEPEIFKPFAVPALASSTLLPAPPTPKPVAPAATPTFAFDMLAKPASPAPAFTPSPVKLMRPDDDDDVALPSGSTSTPLRPADKDAVFLSAKDAALAIAKPALPFFTFDMPAQTGPKPNDAVKDAALAAPTQVFNFSLIIDATPKTRAAKTFVSTPAPALAALTFNPAAPPSGTWTCNLCMLSNPDSEREKCTVCEAPRPANTLGAPAPAAASAAQSPGPVPTPFVMPGFKVEKKAGEWECSVCMCKSPDGADKCVVCETPK